MQFSLNKKYRTKRRKIRICRSVILRYRKSGDPKRYFCTFGEKEHTSKRVSIIACNNVISKVQCATRVPIPNIEIIIVED